MESPSAVQPSGRYYVLRLAIRHLLYASTSHRTSPSSVRTSILPRVVTFFDLRGLVGISLVCKKWKEYCYEPDVVLGCISRGGGNEKDRASFWLLCVGMRDESAAQPMGLLDLVGLNFRSSEGASDTLDDNGEEERRKTLEALTDEDFLNDSSDGRAGSPHAGNSIARSCTESCVLPRGTLSPQVSSPLHSATEHRKDIECVACIVHCGRAQRKATDGCEFDEDLFASGPRKTITQIEKDVDRTANFANTDALRSLLRAISLYLPKSVGYVQGQNFICRILLTVTKEHEEDSFWACVGMMYRFGLLGIICPGMPTLRLRFFQMNRLIMWHLPRLFQHFHGNEVQAELYATSWFITLLSDGALLQEKDILCLWDILFAVCGDRDVLWAVVYRVVLELMRLSEDSILELSTLPSIVGGMSKIMASHVMQAGGIRGLQSSAEVYLEHSLPICHGVQRGITASDMTLSVGLRSSKPVGQQVCGLSTVKVGSEPSPNYIGSAEADSVVVVATSELFGNSWRGSLSVESPANLWKQNDESVIQKEKEDYMVDKLGCDDIASESLPPLCEVETSTGIGALATAKMRSTSGAMIVIGHDSGDAVTYTLGVDEEWLGDEGSLPLVLRPEAILCDHDDVVSAIAVADPWIGKGLASGSWDGTVKMWDFALGQPEFSCTDTLIMGGRVNDLAFAGGNRLVTAISTFNSIYFFDPRIMQETGKGDRIPLPCSPLCVSSLSLEDENMGMMIAVGGEDGTVYLFDQRALQSPVDTIEVGRSSIRCLSSRCDPGLFACGCDNGSVSVIHVSSRNKFHREFGATLNISSMLQSRRKYG